MPDNWFQVFTKCGAVHYTRDLDFGLICSKDVVPEVFSHHYLTSLLYSILVHFHFFLSPLTSHLCNFIGRTSLADAHQVCWLL